MATVDTLGSVLVLGGCGFLGHHIVKALLEADDVSQVSAFDVSVNRHQLKGAHYIQGSITSRGDILKVLEEVKPQVIFHTISPNPLGNTKTFHAVNVEGTRTLLKCCQESDYVKAIVYTSSSSVVHDNHSDLAGVTEELPLLFQPDQPELYSHTKALAEKLIIEANAIGGVRTCSIRPAGLFGEGDHTLTENVIGGSKEGKHKYQIGDDSKLFDFTYVGNNVYAQLLAARALLRSQTEPLPVGRKIDGEAFVITNDDPWHFFDFFRGLGGAAGYPVEKEHIRVVPVGLMWTITTIMENIFWCFTLGKNEPRFTRKKLKYMTIHRYFDITKAKTRLGYVPQFSMDEGIQKTAQWYLSTLDEKEMR